MPILRDCIKYSEVGIKDGVQDEDLIELSQLSDFVESGVKLFGAYKFYDSAITEDIKSKQLRLHKKLYEKFHTIPEKYENMFVGSSYSHNFEKSPFAKMCKYPCTTVGELLDIADKLSMIIVPLDYVDLHEILKQVTNRTTENQVLQAYSVAKANLEAMQYSFPVFYLLCPLSYYSVWKEITSDKENYPKYFPEVYDSIYTSLELMLPAQRNLYMLSKSNSVDIGKLKGSLESNIKEINSRISKIEQRVSKIESQIAEIKAKKEEQEGLDSEEASMFHVLEEYKMGKVLYKAIDPVLFVSDNSILYFDDESTRDKVVRVISCFGPEFPVEFFVQNGLTVINNKIKKIRNEVKKNINKEISEESEEGCIQFVFRRTCTRGGCKKN